MSFYEDHIFPPVMEWAARVFRRQIGALVAQAQGRVLEIGAGTGDCRHRHATLISPA